MHSEAQSVYLDASRTFWRQDTLRFCLQGHEAAQHRRIAGPDLERGVIDLTVDGVPVQVAPGTRLPPPVLIDGHLVAPIVRKHPHESHAVLAVDVDEADRPITRTWNPGPSDLRVEATATGLQIGVDLEFICCPGYDADIPVGLVLERSGSRTDLPARLVPGPGTIGVLRAELPTGRVAPDETYVLLLRTARGTTRLGLDLVLSADGGATSRHSTRVSVVVPVGGCDAFLGDCLGSAVAQTMPNSQYEVIVVDRDYSAETASLLDWLTTSHSQLRVLSTSSSGSDESPEPLAQAGVAAARGEYVFFLDPTDRLTETALQDLCSYARTHDADIVLGKTVGRGSTVPRAPYRRSRPYASIAHAPLVDSLSVHKLFRKEFLDKHDLACGNTPLGRQRFVAEAYLLADRIAIFADKTCYHRIDRGATHGPGGGQGRPDPKAYVAELRDMIALVEKHLGTDAGDGSPSDGSPSGGPPRTGESRNRERTRFLRRWYRSEVLHLLRGEALLSLRDDEQSRWFTELRELAREHFGSGLACGLLPQDRVVAGLLDAGELDGLLTFAEWEADIDGSVDVRQLEWANRTLRLRLRVSLSSNDVPLFVNSGDRVLLDPPLSASGWIALLETSGPGTVDVTGHVKGARIDICATGDGRRRPGRSTRTVPVSTARYDGYGFEIEAELPADDLEPGRFLLGVRIRCCGWSRLIPVRGDSELIAHQRPRLPLRFLRTEGAGPLAVDVPGGGKRPVIRNTEPTEPVLAERLRTVLRILGSRA